VDSPWTESDQSRFVVDDVVYTNSGEALDLFEDWIKNTAPHLDLPPFDQATLFTGSDACISLILSQVTSVFYLPNPNSHSLLKLK